jgi:hypothetical protein
MITFKQRPVIPTFESSPVTSRRIGETDPFLVIDNKLDDTGALKSRLLTGGLVSLLGCHLA